MDLWMMIDRCALWSRKYGKLDLTSYCSKNESGSQMTWCKFPTMRFLLICCDTSQHSLVSQPGGEVHLIFIWRQILLHFSFISWFGCALRLCFQTLDKIRPLLEHFQTTNCIILYLILIHTFSDIFKLNKVETLTLWHAGPTCSYPSVILWVIFPARFPSSWTN